MPRPRARQGGGGVYNPSDIDAWKQVVALAVKTHKLRTPVLGPVALCMTFFFPRTQAQQGSDSPAGPIPHDVKPDGDNLAKAVMDAITQSGAWWKDDCQVYDTRILKFYTIKGKSSSIGCQLDLWYPPNYEKP